MFATARLSLLLAATCSLAWADATDAIPATSEREVVFFVSPRGKDTSTGKSADPGENDGPFATLERGSSGRPPGS